MTEKSLRILFVSSEYPPETASGGIGSSVAAIAPALAARGHDVHVLSCLHCQPYRDYSDRGVHIHRRDLLPAPFFYPFKLLRGPASLGRLRLSVAAYCWYRRLARQYRFDIVEYPDWQAEGLLLSLFRRKGTVAHLHSPLAVLAKYHDLPSSRDLLLGSWLESLAARRACCVTAPSGQIMGELPEVWLGGQEVSVIPYAVDWHRWSNVPSVEMTRPSVVFVGRLERLKMPEVLVEAMHRLAPSMPNAEAVFVGRGNGEREGLPYDQWLQGLAGGTSARCRFLGQVAREELPNLLAQARVVVSTSGFENFPMAVLEAMASGRPVVITANNGIAPLIREQQAGDVVPAGDPGALADALRPYLENAAHAAEVGRRAQAVIRQQLDPERIASLREEVYRRAMARDEKCMPTRGHFPYALSKAVGGFRVPETWRARMLAEAVEVPWKHFYLRTGEQILRLLANFPPLAGRADLAGLQFLDIGCTPTIDVLLASMGAEVTMVDLAAEELQNGIRLAEQLGVSQRLHPVQADAFNLPFSSESYDVVWNSGFIEHFDDTVGLIRLMSRYCRPHGAVMVLVPNRWTPHSLWIREGARRRNAFYWDWMGKEKSFSRRELVMMCKAAGLKVVARTTGNLRRSILDDTAMLPRLHGPRRGRVLTAAMNLTDWVEQKVPPARELGFMVGALGLVERAAQS